MPRPHKNENPSKERYSKKDGGRKAWRDWILRPARRFGRRRNDLKLKEKPTATQTVNDSATPEQPPSTMPNPDKAISDSSAQSSCARDTPVPSESTQSSTASIVVDGKEPHTSGREEGPSRPLTHRPASTWPMAAKEHSDKQPLGAQSSKDKIPITTSLARAYHEARFTECWEQNLLPEIVKILNNNVQGAYSINVRKGDGPDQRVIDLMTKDNCAKMYSELLEAAKKEHLPEEFRSKTRFDFRSGKRVYCADGSESEASLQTQDSSPFEPRNPHRFEEPVMGDSAGTNSTNNTATLGPLLEVNRRLYRLVNWHLFDDEVGNPIHTWDKREPPSGLELVHPSPSDLARYPAGGPPVRIGKVVAYSGSMYKTTRAITSAGAPSNPAREIWKTTTDWALCETDEGGLPNKVRYIFDGEKETCCFTPNITQTTSKVTKGDRVYSTGRSSGYTEGEICMLSYLKNDDGSVRRDWAVSSYAREDAAWEEGMGIFGDSGAGIMDGSNRLIGQLWGRNHYDDEPKEPAITYFTRITDILDDIEERWPDGRCSRPKLPGEVLHTDGTDGTALAITEILNSVSSSEGSTNLLSEEKRLDVMTEIRRSSARSALMVTSNGNKAKHFWVQHAATWPKLQA